MNSGSFVLISHVALRIDLALTPGTSVSELGEYVPCEVLIDQFFVVERIRSIDFVTVVFVPQNGQLADMRALSGVRSISPGPPFHTHSSC